MKVRSVAAASGVILVALATSGCNMFTPQATRIEYDASDGISAKSGGVGVHNAILVGEPEGKALSLNVTFSNSGEATVVEVRLDDASQQIPVPTGLTTFGFEDQQLIFDNVEPEFGATRNMSFAADGAAPAGVPVQMISTDFVGYENLAPIASPTPEPSTPEQSAEVEEGAEQEGAEAEHEGAEPPAETAGP